MVFKGYLMDYQKEFELIEKDLRCPRCRGVVVECTDFEISFFYDHIREYSCIICGYRFGIDLEEIIYKVKIIEGKGS
jgi:DNA-directed RNA polymerase subunit RPC12/RpoP